MGLIYRIIFALLMVLFYEAVGVYVIFFAQGLNNMTIVLRVVFGILLMAYGLFRLYRTNILFKEFKGNHSENEES